MRDSFVLFTKIKEVIGCLTDEQKGQIFQAILDYESDGEVSIDDPVLKVVFIPIRQDLDFMNQKWDDTRKARSEAGKKGAEAKKSKAKQKEAKRSKAEQGEAKQAVYEYEYENVNENEYSNPPTPLQGYYQDEELNEAFNLYVNQCRNGKVDFQSTQRHLYDLANGDRDTMIAILNQSVAQGWTGLHELKNKPKNKFDMDEYLRKEMGA